MLTFNKWCILTLKKGKHFLQQQWWIRDFSFHAWSEFSSYVLVSQLTKGKQQASLSIPAPSFINVKHWSFSLPASTSSLSTFRFENFERVPHEGSHEIVDFSGRINIFHSKVFTPHHISPHLTCKNWCGWQLKPSKKLQKFTRHVTETIVVQLWRKKSSKAREHENHHLVAQMGRLGGEIKCYNII